MLARNCDAFFSKPNLHAPNPRRQFRRADKPILSLPVASRGDGFFPLRVCMYSKLEVGKPEAVWQIFFAGKSERSGQKSPTAKEEYFSKNYSFKIVVEFFRTQREFRLWNLRISRVFSKFDGGFNFFENVKKTEEIQAPLLLRKCGGSKKYLFFIFYYFWQI